MTFSLQIWRNTTYENIRLYILELNRTHCKTVSQLGGNGDVVYDALNKKTEEIWRRMHSDAIPSAAAADDDQDIKRLVIGPRRAQQRYVAIASSRHCMCSLLHPHQYRPVFYSRISRTSAHMFSLSIG